LIVDIDSDKSEGGDRLVSNIGAFWLSEDEWLSRINICTRSGVFTLQLEGEGYTRFASLAALLPTHRIDEDPTTKQHPYIHSLER
jgi:hypothetical protein